MERVEKLCGLLSDAGFDNAVVDTFRENKVDEQVLISLDKEDMVELGVVALGDRKRLQKLIIRLRNEEKENVRPGRTSNIGSEDKRMEKTPMVCVTYGQRSPLSCSELLPDSHNDLENVRQFYSIA